VAGVTYDTGVLLAAERGDATIWSRHRGLLLHGLVPTVPAPVLAQAWRRGSRQARLAQLLDGCQVEPMLEEHAKAVGQLLGEARRSDITDGAVVEGASRRGDLIVTGDRSDIEQVAVAAARMLDVEDV